MKESPRRFLAPLVMLVVVGLLVLSFVTRASANTTQAKNEPCAQSNIRAAETTVPHSQSSGTNAKGSSIAAIVDGKTIPSAVLEAQVAIVQANHQKQLAELSTGVAATQKTILQASTAQIRKQVLDSLISQQIWLKDAKKDGNIVSLATVHQYMSTIIHSVNQQPATSMVYIQFMAYLCANNLTETSFLSDQTLIQGYQVSMTVAVAKNKYTQTLAPAMQRDPAKVQTALNAHVKSLRQNTRVQIFVPSNLLAN